MMSLRLRKKNVLPSATNPSQKLKFKKLMAEKAPNFVQTGYFFEENGGKYIHPNFELLGAL